MNAIVLLNGQPPAKTLVEQYITEDCLILCADGAANYLYPDILPHVIMGDMDSIEIKVLEYAKACGVEIHRFKTEKDETDGQLIVERAIEAGPEQIVILGGLGGRLDHTMGNIQMLVRCASQGIPAFARNEKERIDVIQKERLLWGSIGDTLSLIPLTAGTVASTQGLQYGVDHFLFPLDTPIGISNVFTQSQAKITVHSGCLAAIHNLTSC